MNQLIVLLNNNSIRNGFWKVSRENRFNERDFLDFNSTDFTIMSAHTYVTIYCILSYS